MINDVSLVSPIKDYLSSNYQIEDIFKIYSDDCMGETMKIIDQNMVISNLISNEDVVLSYLRSSPVLSEVDPIRSERQREECTNER